VSSDPLMNPEDLIVQIVRHLADIPEDVRIDTHVTEHTATFDIYVSPTDVGKVLGRGGKHAWALRDLFNAIYGKYGKRMLLQVVDPRR
jgi:predicted RNA-binding protein YlqC (UPF0109 family)